jgi:hypothetical protein
MKSWPVRVLIGVLVLAALLLTLISPNVRRSAAGFAHPDPVGPTIYSKSALGHAAFYRLLQTLDVPVSASEAGSGAHLAAGSVLVIAEPRADETTLQEVRAMLSAETVLLVLPKRIGRADPKRPNWIGEDQLVPETTADKVLHLVDPAATIARRTGDPPAGGPSIRGLQLIHSKMLHPLLAVGDGILVGERREQGRRVAVLSDPDMISNHGLALGGNAAAAADLIQDLRAGRDGTVVFDEFVHGFSPHAFHMLGILFQFPFVLVTMQVGLAVALAIWAATGRFGMPAVLAPPIEAGKRSLIEAGARLLDRWGKTDSLTERYFEAMVRDAGREMRAPRGSDVPALLKWFAQSGRAAPAAAAGGTRQSAQEIYAWRKELIGGPDKHTKHR